MARAPNRLSPFNVVSLALGLAFLYLPIVILVTYSFNASRLVTVWGGWSLPFTLALDDLGIASFTTGAGSATLPIRIYSEVRLGVKPEINAICTLVIALIAVVIVIASFASKLTGARGESAAPL